MRGTKAFVLGTPLNVKYVDYGYALKLLQHQYLQSA